ncbi:nucleotide exchange factor GrpE [Bhargavaea ginsengi]|uniref:nucleotide exchange factor GrpE n=1 Tax=Bhargavaea ginsengi TaxID=426757 RepID=UPI00203C14F9|nr:nucleotide exchange factor GrpE [Bhargavaea ginsengi]MCM3089115.1 nucleotide exchange factor GrpE [Bhargavaea ginsengi]
MNEETVKTAAVEGDNLAEEASTTAPEAHAEEAVETEADPRDTRIAELEEELEQKEDKYLRLLSDFENFKRRSAAEIQASEKYRSQKLMVELLPVLDNFGRAFDADVTSEDAIALKKGMEMISRSFRSALEKEGLEEIEAEGKEFDPNFHHAVMQGQDDSQPSNTILEELQKGYMLKDRILRPSMVKVNE